MRDALPIKISFLTYYYPRSRCLASGKRVGEESGTRCHTPLAAKQIMNDVQLFTVTALQKRRLRHQRFRTEFLPRRFVGRHAQLLLGVSIFASEYPITGNGKDASMQLDSIMPATPSF